MKLSRSRTPAGLKLVVSMVLATSAILVPAGNASAADTQTPTLASFSVSDTTVTPGQPVTFSYVAADDSGSVKNLRLSYTDSIGHNQLLTFDNPATVGSVTITVPDTWASGLVALQYVELTDPSDNRNRYNRSGSTVSWPGTKAGPTHTLKFALSDLTVSESTVDATVPTLTAVSVSGSPVSPGQTISVHYAAAEAPGPLRSVAMWFRDSYQIERTISTQGASQVPGAGVVDMVIPPSWPNGSYVLSAVRLTDSAGNSSLYLDTGRVTRIPAGTLGPSSHTFDFSATTFTVTGSTADFTPPALTSVALTGSPMLPGGTATLSYSAESNDPLKSLSFVYRDPRFSSVVFTADPSKLTGTLPVSFKPGSTNGSYTLSDVILEDSSGNIIRYDSDGSVVQSPSKITGTHSLALSSSDLLMATPPSAPTAVSVRARSGSAFVFWHSASASGSEVSSYAITAQPGGKTVTMSGLPTDVEMTGLTNGTTYRFTVTATNGMGAGPASASATATPRMTKNIFAAGDLSRDGRNDLIALRPYSYATDPVRNAFLYRGSGTGGFTGSSVLIDRYAGSDRTLFSPGDFTGDGVTDVMIIDDHGTLYYQYGDGHGGVDGSVRGIAGQGWGSMRTVFGPGDFSGDRKNDVMAITSSGDLYLYRGNGRGGWAGAGKIGGGWGNFLTVFSRGDFSGDGKNDVMAVSKDGGLYLYRGNGLGGFAAAGQRIGTGWGNFLTVLSPGDFSGDRKTDVMAVNTAGDLLLYRGNGRGGWASGAQKIGSGWGAFR